MSPPLSVKEYDGIREVKWEGGIRTTSFFIGDGLKQDNPRNVFLNGQLYIEKQCDYVLGAYFGFNVATTQSAVFSDFLTSGLLDFSGKIALLSKLLKDVPGTRASLPLVPSKVKTSLKAIGEVRNAFQHNLEHKDAMMKVRECGKFTFIDKKLGDYTDVDILVEDFKKEAMAVYGALSDIHSELLKKRPPVK